MISRQFIRNKRSVRMNLPPSPQRAPPNFNPVLLMGVGGLPGGFGRAAGGRGAVFSVPQLKTGWFLRFAGFGRDA